MQPESNSKKWYQKKRYVIPLIVFGFFTFVDLLGSNNSTAIEQSQNLQSQTTQVKSEAIVIPSYKEPLKIIEEQPTSTNTTDKKAEQKQVNNPAPTKTTPSPVYTEPATTNQTCCKICTKGKACGNFCISRSYTCHKPPGCACDAY